MHKRLFLLATAALVFSSCLDEKLEAPEQTSAGEGYITIQALPQKSSPESKTVFGEDLHSVSWESDDQLSIIVKHPDDTYSTNTVFTKTNGENNFRGKFAAADEPAANTANTWYAIYPYDPEIVSIKYFDKEKKTHPYTADGKVYSMLIDPGTQNGVNNMDHIHVPLFGKGVVNSNDAVDIQMKHITAILRVKFINNSLEPLTVSKVKISVDGTEKLTGKFRVNPDGDYALLGSRSGGKNYAELQVTDGLVGPGQKADFYLMTARIKLDKNSGCTKITTEITTDKGIVTVEKPVDNENNPLILREGYIHGTTVKYLKDVEGTVNPEIFGLLDLSHPGLATVKDLVDQKQPYKAAEALLEYYRNRSDIQNPNVDLSDHHLTTAARNIADQALEYRFYVKNYKEGVQANGQDLFWSFKASDGSINWSFNPPKADKEFGIQKHRHQWMIYQAKAYHCTGDEKYVESILDVYDDWLKTYPYQEGPIDYTEGDSGTAGEIDYKRAWSGLQPAERLLEQLDILWYILPAKALTPERFADFLIMMSKTADKIKISPVIEENSNIRLAQDQAVTTISLLMPEFAKSAEWKEHGIREITRHLNNQFNEDGVQNELDPGYHIGVIGDFLKVYNVAKANNALGLFPENYVPTLKNGCNFTADIIWPDYTIDCFNDTKAWSSRVLLRNMKTYASLFPDDIELAWMASEGTTVEPASRMKVYAQSGWYMLMNGWKKTSMKLILKNNDNKKDHWHCQYDNGTVSVWKNGRCFTPDPGVFSYGGTKESNETRKAFASASIHNTVTKDGADIRAGHARGRLLKQESTAEYKLIVTENPSYPDMTHRRAVYMVGESFYVIVDEAFGSATGNAVLNFSLCRDEAKGIHVVQPDDLSSRNAYGVHTEFNDGNNMLFRTFTDKAEGFNGQTGTCYYSEQMGVQIQRKRYTVRTAKTAGQEARFITVILPFGSVSEIQNLNIDARFKNAASNTPKGAQVEVTVGNRTYNLNYSL